ncbi:hypothetical protein BDEG_27919 [Batrachochytrium dendrobatidis JEL423]|uniref:Uncharacterized protein n=1 Tax=Batrachochytrium dendrobatidis (strain JEL423) TaxID=403673 RepID=A0A177WXB0_BATDL|nr:hypothetical protein BDEG_27919 [Batrachochytrium dendrobatidis JEL423]
MALAAVSPDSSDDKSNLQRRALESSEQDVHMFARSPIPPVNMTPEEKAILKSMEEERDKLKDALEKAKQRETELNQRSKDEGLDQASQLSPELRSEVERLAQMAMENIELKNAVTKLRQTGSVPEKYWDDFIQKHQWSPDLLAQKARLDDMARQRDALKDALDRAKQKKPKSKKHKGGLVKDLSQERDRLKDALDRAKQKKPKSKKHKGGLGQTKKTARPSKRRKGLIGFLKILGGVGKRIFKKKK